MWGEWFANCPMMAFLVIILAGKEELSKKDRTIITSAFVCILCGFLPIIPQPEFVGYGWIAASVIASLPVFLLPRYVSSVQDSELKNPADIEEAGVRGSCLQQQVIRRKTIQTQQFYLVLWWQSFAPCFQSPIHLQL